MDMDDDSMTMDDDSSDVFCHGSGTTMFMEGFTSSLRHRWWHFAPTTQRRHTVPLCLNLFFESWTLDTETKFVLACLGVVLLAVAVEALGAFRRVRAAMREAACRKREKPSGWPHRLETAAVYGTQLVIGYFLMLAVMTYSSELFASAIFGIVLGHVLLRRLGVALGRLTCHLKEDQPSSAPEHCSTYDDIADYRLVVDDDFANVSRGAPFPQSLGLSIPAMTCDACVATVHNTLLACDGVAAVRVDLPNKRAFVHGATLDLLILCTALDRCGYGPVPGPTPGETDAAV